MISTQTVRPEDVSAPASPDAVPVARGFMPMRGPGLPALMRNEVGIPHPVVFGELGDAAANYFDAEDWFGGERPSAVAMVEIRFLGEWPILPGDDTDLPLSQTSQEYREERHREWTVRMTKNPGEAARIAEEAERVAKLAQTAEQPDAGCVAVKGSALTLRQILDSRRVDREPFAVEVGRERTVFLHACVDPDGAEFAMMRMGADPGEEHTAMYATRLEAMAGTLPDGFSGSFDDGPPRVTIYRATLRVEAVEVDESEVAKFVEGWEAEARSLETLAGSDAGVPDPGLVVDAAGTATE